MRQTLRFCHFSIDTEVQLHLTCRAQLLVQRRHAKSGVRVNGTLGTMTASPDPTSLHMRNLPSVQPCGTLLIQGQFVENTMLFTVEALEAEALNLSIAERSRLDEKLIASLGTEPDVEAAWATEVERRHAEIESGTISLMPGAETLARLKAEFQ